VSHIRDAMDSIRTVVAQVLNVLAPPLRQIAAELGVSASALRRYRLENRTPDAEVVARLVGVLRRRGRAMESLADRLEATIGKGGA
jgi:transcriptional regulator with XRE-family HTH domain